MEFKLFSAVSNILKKKSVVQTAKLDDIKKPRNRTKISSRKRKSSKKSLGLKFILIILATVIVLFFSAASGVFAYNKIYQDKIYPGIYVADTNLAGLTIDEAKALLDSRLDTYQKDNITLIVSNNQKWTPSFSELGFKPDIQESVNQAYAIGRNGDFFICLKKQLGHILYDSNLSVCYKLDESALDSYLNKIGQKVNKPTLDATLVFEGTTLKLIPSEKGSVIDKKDLEIQTREALKFLRTKLVKISFKNQEPKIKEKDTKEAKNTASLMTTSPIYLAYKNYVYTVDPSQIASWIVFTPAKKEIKPISKKDLNNSLKRPAKEIWYLRADLDEGKIKQYLETIAWKVNIKPKDTKVTYSGNEKFVLEQGYDGQTLDIDGALTQIKEKIYQPENRRIALFVKAIPAGEIEATKYGIVPITKGKYIDISLSLQVLTCFDGGKAQFITLISSGINRYPTPSGTFHVYSKTPSTRMKHEYGPGHPDNYDLLNVPYVLYFDGPNAIHGTYWHNNFGTPMSHACVNVSTSAAAQIYNWSPIGTMVYIHW
jgi:lipoprotein-anchoring transpeptidase ErfK/SrfK